MRERPRSVLASEFPFKRIIGVEFSAELAAVARRNVASFRSVHQQCRSLDVLCLDAVDYVLPEEPAVLYFFNPFLESVLTHVPGNIRCSYRAVPRQLYLVVTGDAPLSVFANAGFARVRTEVDALHGQRVFTMGAATPTVHEGEATNEPSDAM